MNKAYDRLEWDFLSAMTGKMGFADGWINLILMCVSTVRRYHVLYEGEDIGPILPQRGLR